jgi:Transcription factor WhiB
MITTGRRLAHEPLIESFDNDAPWMKQGACTDPSVDSAIFFPSGRTAQAQRAWDPVCNSCPVKALCYQHGAANEMTQSVWGGVYFNVKGQPGYRPGQVTPHTQKNARDMAERHYLLSKDVESLTGICSRCGECELKWYENKQYHGCMTSFFENREKRNAYKRAKRAKHG